MNVVNRDFRDWFLAYHLDRRLQIEKPELLCLTAGNENAYMQDVISKYKSMRVVWDLSAFAHEQSSKKVLALLKLPSGQRREDIAAFACGADVWNIAADYADYESKRLPQDYLLNEFHVGTEADFLDYTTQRDSISAEYIIRYIKKRFIGKQKAFFNKLEIETINRCNGTCSFCPVNQTKDPRPLKRMEERLFSNIIHQLKERSYSGALGLFSNNEPLLDKRLPYFTKLARESLPNAFLYIYTNGILLSEPLLWELLPELDWIHVDCYTGHPELSEEMERLRTLCQKRHVPPEKISFHLRNRNEFLTNRAGTAPNRHQTSEVKSLCTLPFSQMIVRPDGKVSQCCNDALGRATYGDLTVQTLDEVWFGEPMESLRRRLLSAGRKANRLCCGCDTIFTCLSYEERSLRDEPIPFFTDYSGLPNN